MSKTSPPPLEHYQEGGSTEGLGEADGGEHQRVKQQGSKGK